ncbi:cysteine desulfurase family protein [Turicibacter sanguinis]|uniref:Aminotransferase class V-fold PLP-dependent enzyme n=2 Tax=Turicibacter sanguinis TaxID=154288 RepID=A0A6A8SJ65_9FIRM|nr:cysteine desulfurase family protein [Turicibacter sanguinis]EFF63122.1 putative cysteine desulfurase [Turicibacter sanguinis PC909]MCU7190969.1 cysteine desulfurase [Turicibacter sanguinis]MCU7211076.1 cysteine desulfurase [Turicibacter sanguinis]MDB8540568.1 cysteine desulfurase family protein [Turicibacter sanguinis]MDB8543195.1 cysteine desulfurase family protein [Turicibacter sanguinis]
MIYLDNSATTSVDPEVLTAFTKVNQNFWGNPSSLHAFGARAEQLLIQAEKQTLSLLNAKQHKVIFTSGATESNNLAIRGVCHAYKNRGCHIITTPVEHASVYETAEDLEQEGFRVTFIDVKKSKTEILKQIEEAICEDTILISCMHVNNEMGMIFPIYEIGQLIKKYPKIKFHVDAVQSVGKIPVDMDKMNIDLLSFSAHKFHGLKGCGALVMNQYLKLVPEITGGHQMYGLRSGTINVAGAVALAKALRLAIEPLNANYNHVKSLYDYTVKELKAMDGVTVNDCYPELTPYIINFAVENIKGETLVHALEEHDVYISAKSACSSKSAQASRILLALGVSEEVALDSVRLSFANTSTLEEATQFINALKLVVVQMRKEMMK